MNQISRSIYGQDSVFIGVVTVLYNSEDVLPDFYASLQSQTEKRFRLYVIDNSPEDNGYQLSILLAARLGINTHHVRNNVNEGVAKGNNQGIELALRDGCKQILLANNDTTFLPETFAKLLSPLVEDGEVASTCYIGFHNQPEKLWFERGEIFPFRALTPHQCSPLPISEPLETKQYTRYAPTCFMMLTRDVFGRVGMMDERYFVYFDDSDFVWRMLRAGMKIRLICSKLVLHKVSSSTGGNESAFSLYYMHRNRMRFARKHNPWYLKPVSLAYIVLTRLIRTWRYPAMLRSSVWRGLWHGFAA